MSTIIQFRAGTPAQWTAANPILSDKEVGVERGSLLWKMGDGVTHWNDLPYRTPDSGLQEVMTLHAQAVVPPIPAAGQVQLFAKTLGGRVLPRIQGPYGLSIPLQPAFFRSMIVIISTNQTTTLTSIGNPHNANGTISHPAVNEDYGYMANFASGGGSGNTCGTGTAIAMFLRGTTVGKSNGFFMAQRIAFPDAAYTQTGAASGSRIFAGMTSNSLATQVGSDTPAGHYMGFVRLHTDSGRQDVNWQVVSKDGVTESVVDSGMLFQPLCVYDVYLFAPPASDRIFWRIDNFTTGETAEGVFVTPAQNLPNQTTPLRAGFQVISINAVVRNARMQRIYVESDR